MAQNSFTLLEIQYFFQVSKHYENISVSASEETCALQKVRMKLL